MKPLRRFLDRIEPLFQEGGKLEKLYPLYEALDTFLYTPGDVTRQASHVRDGIDLKRMMIIVVVALLPCFYMAFWNTGFQANRAMQHLGIQHAPGWRGAVVETIGGGYDPESWWANMVHGAVYFVPVLVVCYAVGGAWEILFACVRRHDINEGFLVTGALIPLILPPTIPLWQVALGTTFGVVIGKEVFGGTGRNFLNPALTARAFLFFAYPAAITGDAVWTAVDGFSGATPLGALASVKPDQIADVMARPLTEALAMQNGLVGSIGYWDAFLGTIQGSMGETSTLACLIGAALLIWTGVGSWRIMLSVLLGTLGLASLLWGIGQASDQVTNAMFLLPPWWHLVLGGFAFGVVFMATDPVSAAMTYTGQWIYGILIGVLTVLIRVVNAGFPEGVMLAILLGNVFAPLIDHWVVQANIKRRMKRYAAP